MRRRKKNKKLYFILLLLILIIINIGFTFAKFIKNANGQANLKIGDYVNEVSNLEFAISDIGPGDSQEFCFTVSNSKDNKKSDVVEEYIISLDTTANLPLKYQLLKDDTVIKEDVKSFSSDVQELGLDSQTDNYKLIISWPLDSTVTARPQNVDYMLEIDYINIKVRSYQKV